MSWREDRLIHGKLDIGHQLAPNPMKLPSAADEKESGRLGIQAFTVYLNPPCKNSQCTA
jgi:hypothetical protein